MRNLKRVLSLALATVMLLGMMVMGTGAANVSDFTDADQISNKEAAAITTAIGIFDGYGDGTFRPTKIVTRAEMATIICKMLYGANVDGASFGGMNIFSDVTENWQIGYVNLCSSLNIVNGYGDGTFHPDQTVSTAEAALMLCKALGYFRNDAEYGNNWKLAAISKATRLGMFGELRLSPDDGLTRDSVSVMAFNTLANAVPVDYSSTFDTYYPLDMSWQDPIPTYQDLLEGGRDQYLTLGYRNLRLVRNVTSGSADEYGRPAVTWGTGIITNPTGAIDVKIQEKIIDATDTPIATYTSAQRSVNLTGYTFPGAGTNVDVHRNGEAPTALAAKDAKTVAGLTANDSVVEIYANKNKVITDIVVVKTDAAKVTSVSNAKKTVNLTVEGVGSYTIGEKDPCFNDIFGNVAVGDYVMIVGYKDANDNNKNKIRDAYLPEVVTGTVSYVNTDGNKATVDGQDYTAVADGKFNRSMVNTVQTMYIDRNGKVRQIADATDSYDGRYMFLTNLYQETVKVNGVPTVKVFARGVLEDGSVTTIEVANTIGAAGTTPSAGDHYTLTSKSGDLLYLYSVTGSPATNYEAYGQVVELKDDDQGDTFLVVPEDDSANIGPGSSDKKTGVDVAFTSAINAGARQLAVKDSASTQDIYVSENVKMIFVGSNNDHTQVTAQTVDQIQSVAANKTAGVVMNVVDGKILVTAIFVEESLATSTDLIYISGAYEGTQSYTNANGIVTKGYRYKAFINGQEQKIIADNGGLNTGFYTSVPNGGAQTLTLYATNVVAGTITGAYRNGITIGPRDYLLDSAEITDTTNNGLTTFAAIQSEVNNGNVVNVHLYYNTVNSERQVVGLCVDSNKESKGGVVAVSDATTLGAPDSPKAGHTAAILATGTVTNKEDTTLAVSAVIDISSGHTVINNGDMDSSAGIDLGTYMGKQTATGVAGVKEDFIIVKVVLPAAASDAERVAIKQTNEALKQYYNGGPNVNVVEGNVKFTTYTGFQSDHEFYIMLLSGKTATLELDYGYSGTFTNIPAGTDWNGEVPEDFEPDCKITIDGTGFVTVAP